MSVRIIDELSNRFAYHAPKDDATRDAHEEVREAAYAYAAALDRIAPPGREKALAMTNLEQAMMWGNAAIARAGGLAQLERGDTNGDNAG